MRLVTATAKTPCSSNELYRGFVYVLRCWFGLFVVSQITAGAFASSVVPPSFSELVNESDYIVRAVVKSVTPEERATATGSKLIFSKVELEVKKVIAGKPPSPLILDVLGGTIGDLELAISDAPKFTVGEESIFFVQGNHKQIFPLVRIMHGLYRIQRDPAQNREHVSRSDGRPLQSTSEVSQPIHEAATTTELLAEQARSALSPDDFILAIRAAVTKPELRGY